MYEVLSLFLDKIRYLFVGLLIIGSVFLLSTFLSSLKVMAASGIDGASNGGGTMLNGDNTNALASSMSTAVNGLSDSMHSLTSNTNQSLHSLKAPKVKFSLTSKPVVGAMQTVAVTIGRGTTAGIIFTGHSLGSGLGFAGRSYMWEASLVLNMPDRFAGYITPADSIPVPVIDANSPELHAAIAALPPVPAPTPTAPAASPTPAPSNAGPIWPIHGAITTEFGASDWPYQSVHTGIDISDGKRPGITPVKAFRSGKVIEVIHSAGGLGNHVTIDHGNGVTSVYGHLASVAVSVGQIVDTTTTVGLEGSTGASTGTHLHFEIRVNGQAANPKKFISGTP